MRVMVLAKATEGMELGEPTPEALEAFAAMDRFTEELVKAGVFVAAAGLKNGAQSKRIVTDGASRTVIDGPFAETRELVVGFSIWEVKDMDEAHGLGEARAHLPGRDGNPAVLRGGGSGRVCDARGARGGPPRRGTREARRRLIPRLRSADSLPSFGAAG